MKPFTVGDFAVSSIIEREGPIRPPAVMFPTSDPQIAAKHLQEMSAQTWSPTSGILFNTYQTFVLRRGGEVILIDTCVGENKARPPHFGYSKQPWLDGLARQGLGFEDVSKVINTHLHVDHCGWNTRLVKGRWVATFPRATYYMGRVEFEYWRQQTSLGWELPGRVWTDSALPLVEAGCARLVETDSVIADDLRLRPAIGHTPGHFCVTIESRGQRAIFVGDLMHHPVQCREPHWSSCFCVDPELAAATRRKFFEAVADTDTIIVPEHFPYPTAGRIIRDGNTFRWKFLDD
jgi:glyoxylase-like metal-dependent hydrolase (beta-lactamase superfamily II)